MSDNLISGIHHITALAGDPQRNLDFYTGILGLRFVKKTVNFDAPEVYHFYYGNENGDPGTILTFFPFEGSKRGRIGKGIIAGITFSVSTSSFLYWEQRLKQFNIGYQAGKDFLNDAPVLQFSDHDGLILEITGIQNDTRTGFTYGDIPEQHAIKGFHHALLMEHNAEHTARLLTEKMNHKLVGMRKGRSRYSSTDMPGSFIDILHVPDQPYASNGSGTVHHIAFAVRDEQSQLAARYRILESGLDPTGVIDRQYFKSVYFREPGGILFEFATAGPGFAIDETKEKLGEELKLPPQYENYRTQIEKRLKPVHLNIKIPG